MLQTDVWMPPFKEGSYLFTLMRNLHEVRDFEIHWDWWSIVKRLVRNRSLSPTRDREYLAVVKELASREDATPDFEAYERLFAPAHGKLTGEISPVYSNFTVEQIRHLSPAFDGRKLFMVARDPVDRFWADVGRHYRYRAFGDDVDYGSLETAQRVFDSPWASMHHFPTKLLARWNEALGEGQVRIFYFDDIVAAPTETLHAILDFVGADPRRRIPLPASLNRKGGDERPEISAQAGAWVRNAFQDELEACSRCFPPYGERWQRRHAADGADVARTPTVRS